VGFGDGVLLACRVSVVGMSGGRNLESEKEDGCCGGGIGERGIWVFTVDEVRICWVEFFNKQLIWT
jgi:hypothetical protein